MHLPSLFVSIKASFFTKGWAKFSKVTGNDNFLWEGVSQSQTSYSRGSKSQNPPPYTPPVISLPKDVANPISFRIFTRILASTQSTAKATAKATLVSVESHYSSSRIVATKVELSYPLMRDLTSLRMQEAVPERDRAPPCRNNGRNDDGDSGHDF